MQKTLSDWKYTKSHFSTELTAVTNIFMTKQFFLWILQYNIRKSLKIQKLFLINKKICKFNIIVIQKQSCNINVSQMFSSTYSFFHLVKNSSF